MRLWGGEEGGVPPSDSSEDSEGSITPPSSPVLGYSGGIRDGSFLDNEDSELLFCFDCKGAPKERERDSSFSPNGYILRRQLITAVESLTLFPVDPESPSEEDFYVPRFFAHSNPLRGEGQEDNGNVALTLASELDLGRLRNHLRLARKNVHGLQIMGNPEWRDSSGFLANLEPEPQEPVHQEDSEEFANNYNRERVLSEPREKRRRRMVEFWGLRKDVTQLLNFMAQRANYFRAVGVWRREEEVEAFFSSFMDAFRVEQNWPAYLKAHGGSREGNEECTSPLYHLFHVMLEMRWALMVIFKGSDFVLKWILDDLVALAWTMFCTKGGTSTIASEVSLLNKQPFNCWCVKELWTMIQLLCQELGVNFWMALNSALKKFLGGDANRNSGPANNESSSSSSSSPSVKLKFSLWLITNVAFLADYELNGSYTPGKGMAKISKDDYPTTINSSNTLNGYGLINERIKEWVGLSSVAGSSGGKSLSFECEMYQMLIQLVDYWGFDSELLFILWGYWLPKLDKVNNPGAATTSLNHYSSVEKWTKLVYALSSCPLSSISPSRKRPSVSPAASRHGPVNEIEKFIANDAFLSFLKLLIGHVKFAEGKDWKKLKSRIGMNLGKNNVGNFGETGLVRVTTLYLGLASCTSDASAMCDRLKELLQYGKQARKTVLRGMATATHILLQKQVPVATHEMAKSLMTLITTVMSQAPLDSAKKENVMIYLELLDSLIKTSPLSEVSLGRDSLISPNLTMWLLACGPNYVVRTLRVLRNLTGWIISLGKDVISRSAEGRGMIAIISERTIEFLRQCALLKTNRIPSTDVQPIGELAADLTLFSSWNFISSNSNLTTSVPKLFDMFGLNELTCPDVSQSYVERLILYRDSVGRGISDVKWYQSWVRLNALGASIPEELNEKVLDPGFSSTDNVELLRRFCQKSEEWSRMDLQNILQPLVALIKAAVGGSLFKEVTVASIVRACGLVIRILGLERLYAKGDAMSVGVHVLNHLIPPFLGVMALDKLPRSMIISLRDHLFHILKALITFEGYESDGFLQRKIQDIVSIALLRYTDERMDQDHPAVVILLFLEDNVPSIITQFTISIGNMAKSDLKLTQRLVSAVTSLKNEGMVTTVISFLPNIISTYLTYSSPYELPNICYGIITYCCQFGFTPYKNSIIQAFDSVMETSFAFKSKRFFDLAFSLTKAPKWQVKKFLRLELLDLYKKHVIACENRRGTGTDKSLRDPLEKLDRDSVGFGALCQ